MSPPADLRIDDLAQAAGTTVRNVRYYQEQGVLPPPRRAGRVAWYSDAHLARLRLIASLLERGFTLASISELLQGWGQGLDLGTLLGFGQELVGPFTDEVPDVGTAEEIAERYGLTGEAEAARRALAVGLLEIDGVQIRVPSPRLLRAGVELHRAGVPYEELFDELQRVRSDMEALAGRLVGLVTRTVIEPHLVDGMPVPAEVPEMADVIRRIRPLATTVVTAELARALELKAQAEFGDRLSRILSDPSRPPQWPGPRGR